MRKERFTEEQMVAIMREADREPVAVVAKRHGISEQTIYVWRKRFGGLQSNDVRRLTANAAGRSMAAMANSLSNTSWSIVRGAERSARAAASAG